MIAPAIGDYGLIGDCRAAALVSRDGAVDWLVAPRFDSPAVFAAILDPARGGAFRLQARDIVGRTRRYLPETNILETTISTETGRVRLTDLMPVSSQADKRRQLLPDHELVRIVECLEGEVAIDVCCEPRPDYGRQAVRFDARGALGFFAEIDGHVLVLRTDAEVAPNTNRTAVEGRLRLAQGDRRAFVLSIDARTPAVLSALGATLDRRVRRASRWWRQWAARCRYTGPHRDAVVRSALVLKLLSFAPSGAIVAAPTTSLPEAIGGPRNWDYRFCWLRDASLTLRALFGLGYEEEGRAFLACLMHATRLTWPELQVLYDVYGESRLPEHELPHLAGHAGSRPVRIGNAAAGQLQLDIYGEVLDAVLRFVRLGGHLDRSTRRMIRGLGETVCARWFEPDEGIWEPRAARRHHTLSRAMCWVALDRLVSLHAEGHLEGPVERFRIVRDEIRAEIETRGYNAAIDSYVAVLDGRELDASLLLLGLYHYVEPADPRMVATCRRIYERLGRGSLLYRYLHLDDGLPPGEGTFGIAGFWGVQCLAQAGACGEARTRFEELIGFGNDLGLFAEQYDPDTGDALGNFPQAFTHVGLINAALTLEACERGRDPETGIAASQALAEEHV